MAVPRGIAIVRINIGDSRLAAHIFEVWVLILRVSKGSGLFMKSNKFSVSTVLGGSRLARVVGGSVLAALLLTGCGGSDEFAVPYEERPVEEIYNKGLDYMEAGEFRRASAEFDEVERQHPYSQWARRAMLMAAFTNYKTNEYDSAILAAQRFLSLFPGNKDAAYAHYLIGMSYYEQISDVRRDQKMTDRAYQSLLEVVRRYPDTEYALDARLKVDLTVDHLAGKEMAIGRYYLKERNYLAAINRFRVVLEKYQSTTHIEEALTRLTETYLALGVQSEAQTAAAILGHNYPGGEWYQDSYAMLEERGLKPVENEDSWISKAWKGIGDAVDVF